MSVYCKTDLLIYAESLYTGRYFFNITNKTKNSPCDYGFCIIYIVNRDRKIIVYDKTTIMCMLTQEWILEQHGLDGEKHKMRIKYLFYKIVI